GLTPAEQLDAIAIRLHPLIARQYRSFRELLRGPLAAEGIGVRDWAELDVRQRTDRARRLADDVAPPRTPKALTRAPGPPFPPPVPGRERGEWRRGRARDPGTRSPRHAVREAGDLGGARVSRDAQRRHSTGRARSGELRAGGRRGSAAATVGSGRAPRGRAGDAAAAARAAAARAALRGERARERARALGRLRGRRAGASRRRHRAGRRPP